MSILILQHGADGGPGRLGLVLRDYGFALDVRRADVPLGTKGVACGVPRDLDDLRGIVVLGGEQNVTDIARYPWMQEEVALIKRAHAAGLPVLGICLGSQVIAHALGGTVSPRARAECGFRMMDVTVPGQTETMMAGVPWRSPQLFFCGQEIAVAPPGAAVLASTASSKVAVYRVGMRTFGFLNHLEHDQRAAMASAAWVSKQGGAGAEPAMAEQLREHYGAYARVSERLCRNIAEYLFPESRRLVA